MYGDTPQILDETRVETGRLISVSDPLRPRLFQSGKIGRDRDDQASTAKNCDMLKTATPTLHTT